jgi:hypothetical protein
MNTDNTETSRADRVPAPHYLHATHLHATRRRFGLMLAAGVAAPGLALADTQDRQRIAAAEAALAQAVRSGNSFEVIKARVTLANSLRSPFLGQTEADRSRAYSLYLANSGPRVRQVTAGGWGLSRYYLALMCLEERRAKRAKLLPVANQAIIDARTVLPVSSAVSLSVARLGLTIALLRRPLVPAGAGDSRRLPPGGRGPETPGRGRRPAPG